MSILKKFELSAFSDRMKQILNQYVKEIKYLNLYVIAVALVVFLCYSMIGFLSVKTITELGAEDHFFEWLTCIFFFGLSAIYFWIFIKTKNLFILLFAIVMFIGAGEEISWGQRIFKFSTPEELKQINVQGEFTLHNITIFHGVDSKGNFNNGLNRLLEVNFLFKLFTMLFGIALPFCVYHVRFISLITTKIRFPVPPISIGLFFIINFMIYWSLHSFILPKDSPQTFINAIGEIFECLESFIMFMIGLYFYNKYKIVPLGKDIKQVI